MTVAYVPLLVLAVGKGIDRAHGKSDVRHRVRMPLIWNMLTEGMDRVIEVGPEESVIWRGLALSFHLLRRVSEIWAYGHGLAHPDFCLNKRDLLFFAEAFQLPWENRKIADRVEVTLRASDSDNKRVGAIVTRTRVVIGNEGVGDG